MVMHTKWDDTDNMTIDDNHDADADGYDDENGEIEDSSLPTKAMAVPGPNVCNTLYRI